MTFIALITGVAIAAILINTICSCCYTKAQKKFISQFVNSYEENEKRNLYFQYLNCHVHALQLNIGLLELTRLKQELLDHDNYEMVAEIDHLNDSIKKLISVHQQILAQ